MTAIEKINEFYLLHSAPTVLCSRGFRSYTHSKQKSKNKHEHSSRRLIDLWQNGGSAVLGHTPPSLLKEIKNTASRGLYAPFPHFMEDRFRKALSLLIKSGRHETEGFAGSAKD